MTVCIGQANIDDPARVGICVAEQAQSVEDADPAVLERLGGIICFAHAANGGVKRGPNWFEMSIELRRHFVEALQQSRQYVQRVRLEDAEGLEEEQVLIPDLRHHARASTSVHCLQNSEHQRRAP